MPSLSPLLPFPILIIIFASYLWTLWKLWRIDQDKKAIYLIFRLAATLIIFFCALRPSWKTSKEVSSKQSLYILIDSSLSMSIKDELPSRLKQQVQLLKVHQELIESLDKLRIEQRFFDLKIHQDEPATLGNATSVSKAIQECLREDSKIKSFLLMTDGLHNHGPGIEKLIYTLQQRDIPVYFIAAGKEKLQGTFSDASVESINSPEFIQVDQSLEVQYRVRLKGLKDKEQQIELVHNDVVLLKRSQRIKSNDEVLNLKFTLPEKTFEEGYQVITLRLPARTSEITPLDNQSQRLIYVRKEGLKVLLLTGSPGPDYKFVRRTLETNPFFSLTSPSPFLLSSNESKNFWSTNDINDYDLIILCRLNDQILPKNFYNKLYDFYTLNKKGVLFFTGDHLRDYSRKNLRFGDSLPLKLFSGRNETEMLIKSDEKDHFILKNLEIPDAIDSQGLLWDSDINPGTTNIIHSNNKPVLSCRDWGKSRLAMIQINSLWQLKLNGNSEFYDELFNRLFYYLCAREQDLKDRLTIRSDRLNYLSDENQFFTASVKNEEGESLQGQQVKLILDKESKVMSPIKQFYTYNNKTELNGLVKYHAESKVEDEFLESSKGQLLVQSQLTELKDISPNLKLLNSIAENTKGAEVPRNQLAEWLKKMNRDAKVYSASTQIKRTPLWDNPFILILIISFFSLEWYWRKFKS